MVYRAAATRRRFLQAVRGSRRRTPPCPPVAHYRCPFIREPNSSRANGTSSHDSVLIGAVLARACLTRERQNCPDRPGTGRHGAPPAPPPERSIPSDRTVDNLDRGSTTGRIYQSLCPTVYRPTWCTIRPFRYHDLEFRLPRRRCRRLWSRVRSRLSTWSPDRSPLGGIAAGVGGLGGLVSGRLSARMVEGMLYAISPTGPGWIGESTAKRLRVRRATSVRWLGGEEYGPWCGDDQ